jgi:hypothetical protein
MLLNQQQHQKSVAQVAIAKRGWFGFAGSVGMSLSSCINRNSLLIGMSVRPNASAEMRATRYLDSGLTEGFR